MKKYLSLFLFLLFAAPVLAGSDPTDISATPKNLGVNAMGGWFNNCSIVRATTSVTGDSVKITSADGTALSATNVCKLRMPAITAGQVVEFSVTADATINLTGAHWGAGTTGDITGRILRVIAVNDNTANLRWCVGLLGNRSTILTTDTTATATSATNPESLLCNTAVGSASNRARELGYFVSDFDDTGGSSEDLNTTQAGVNDFVTGESADGLWQPWNPGYGGFSANPTGGTRRWTQIGRKISLNFIRSSVGTSNSTSFTITAPAKALNAGSSGITQEIVDNGASLTTTGMFYTAAGSVTVTLYKDAAAGTWTNISTKHASFIGEYEVGPAASFIQ